MPTVFQWKTSSFRRCNKRLSLYLQLSAASFVLVAVVFPCAVMAEIDAQAVVDKGIEIAGELSGLKLGEGVEGVLVETRDEAIDVMWKLFRRDYPEDEFRIEQDIMERLGYYIDTPETDEELMALFVEGIAGVYDPDENIAYVVSRDARDEIEEEMRRRGCRVVKYDFENDANWYYANQELIVMVHEMTHAIQDRHFDLNYFEEKYDANTDATLAFMALVEGMAEFVEQEFVYKELFNFSQRFLYDPQNNLYVMLERARDSEESGNDLFDVGRDSCGDMRSYTGMMWFIKYVYGRAFVEKASMEYGWNRFAEMFRDYPLSTEQILHPEKYFDEKHIDLPCFIWYPDFYSVLPGDFEFVDSDSLGEYRLYLLVLDQELGGRDAIMASEGWDGDRYYAFRHPESGDIAISWISVWDTENDASEFISYYNRILSRKELSVNVSSKGDDFYKIEASDYTGSIERRGNVVVIVEGMQDPELGDAFREITFEADIEEANYDMQEVIPEWLRPAEK